MSKNQPSLYFCPDDSSCSRNTQGINPVVRSSFRLRLGPKDNAFVAYQNNKFPVHNLSEHGLQLESNADYTFSQDQILKDMELHFSGHSASITAQVIYSFQMAPDCYLIGLDILSFFSDKEKKLLQDFLQQKKEQLFSK